ncbi:MAG: tRNA guanosine(34) transglycosylase Tgt [Planctomycetota bacterium]|nr:tRNA guanosine(34) transglycosylase Tgt [Planctomycetota bacterium]
MSAGGNPVFLEIARTDGKARAGGLHTPHGTAPTPLFMVVATAASVKGMTPAQLREARARVLLANTYHLALRPGEAEVGRLGGLAAFMGWHGPTLTDSGGYQIFSLAKKRRVELEGVRFNNHIDGTELFLTPERAVRIQEAIASDIMMCLDECPPAKADRAAIGKSLTLTHAWAKRAKAAWRTSDRQALFGIAQGALFEDLRRESAECLSELDFPGYAIGGVAVGEDTEDIRRIVAYTAPLLPSDKPRYLMGVGTPEDIICSVAAGVDMFDCVMPTRHARHYQAFTRRGKINLKNRRFLGDSRPIDEACDCEACRSVSRAYLRHLSVLGELMASVWITIHNVRFYLRLMEDIRAAVFAGNYAEFAKNRLDELASGGE